MRRNNNPIRLGALIPGVVKAMAAVQGKRVEDLLDEEELQRGPQPESVAEALVWDAVQELRHPALEGLVLQHPLWAFRIDFALPDLRIGFEIDGHAYHSDKLTFDRDRRRHRHIELQGWRLVRFSGQEACDNPQRVAREMAEAVVAFTPQVPEQASAPDSERGELTGGVA